MNAGLSDGAPSSPFEGEEVLRIWRGPDIKACRARNIDPSSSQKMQQNKIFERRSDSIKSQSVLESKFKLASIGPSPRMTPVGVVSDEGNGAIAAAIMIVIARQRRALLPSPSAL